MGSTVGACDPAHPLLIDPTCARHSVHGSAGDSGCGIAVEGTSAVLVTRHALVLMGHARQSARPERR